MRFRDFILKMTPEQLDKYAKLKQLMGKFLNRKSYNILVCIQLNHYLTKMVMK
ncbi:hypothetical protein F898_03244 [Acinetobacter courvalinii]|nr:hypothetical protein F898_03244 [Acinetobacter courvalinii]